MTSSSVSRETIRKRPSAKRGRPLADDEPATLAELFLDAAKKFPHENSLNYKRDGSWRAISAATMIERIENIALGLYSLGMRKGDRVAIMASNSPEWTLTDAGCQFAGIIDVPIYTTLAPEQVKYVLNDSATRILAVDDIAGLERVRASIAGCSSVEKFVLFNSDGADADDDVVRLADLERLGAELRGRERSLIDDLINAVEPDDVATLIYTSGTTGEPKGVMLTQNNLISNAIDAAEKFTFSGRDISLSVLPLSHVFERTGMYVYIYHGMAVHFAESIEKVPDDLKEVRPTIFIGVPRIFEKVFERARTTAARSSPLRARIFDWAIEVAKDAARVREDGKALPVILGIKHRVADRIVFKKFREFFGGRLRFCITGGAALADEIYLIFTGAGIGIMQGYGLTETSPVISSNNPGSRKLGTVGRPIRNAEIRIAEDGEIEVRSPGVMLGYFNKPEATEAAFTTDGWFRTGDIGNIDADRFLSITDRKKELFKTSGGKYIAPSPIEQMISSSKFISQTVLVGSERKFPAALIVPNFEMLASYAELKGLDLKTPAEFCANERIRDLIERQIAAATEGLSRFEKVKNFALLETELTVAGGELTPTLKVKRRVVNEKFRREIDALYDGNYQ